MSPEEAIRDPVFQLNLLVWMAKEQPQSGFRVRALFHEHGFQLHYIEQPFPFPTEARNQIESIAQTLSLEINLNPELELTVQRHTDGRAIYFEAKAQGFSQASSNSRQARGHLLACGPSFAEVYKPLASALLDYVVPSEDVDSMRNCLSTLKAGLKSAKLEAGDFAVDGLSIRGTELVYHLDKPIRTLLATSEKEVAVMNGLDQETDPSPLLLVYSDEDCPDAAGARAGHYRRVLQNQAVANLLCILHSRTGDQIHEISAQELLKLTTVGVFDFLGRGRQKSMERVITENIFRRISNTGKTDYPTKFVLSRRRSFWISRTRLTAKRSWTGLKTLSEPVLMTKSRLIAASWICLTRSVSINPEHGEENLPESASLPRTAQDKLLHIA